jgi:hypothetical protein
MATLRAIVVGWIDARLMKSMRMVISSKVGSFPFEFSNSQVRTSF